MARPAKFKTYDMKVGQDNMKLRAIARQVLNRELPIRYKISLRDAILAMKEKERLGFNFNRSLTASLRSRWDVVENATLNFLQEIVDMNDQIEEDSKKNERQLLSLIFTRSTNISLEARVEQMGGLYMRMNFYKKVLEERIKQYDPCRNFLLQCCEMMGYLQPGQLLDRYAALNHVFKELYKEYDDRMMKMNKLQEKLQEIKSETDHRNMLLHNEMSELHMKLKNLNTRITYMEYELNEKLDQSTNTEMEIYRIKNSIHRSYVALMNYRGLEPTETNPFLQLEHILTRIKNAQDVIKYIRDDAIKQHLNFRRRHKEFEGEIMKTESFSSTSMETFLSEFNENKMVNRPLNSKVLNSGAGYKQMAEKEESEKVKLQQTTSSAYVTYEPPSAAHKGQGLDSEEHLWNGAFNATVNNNHQHLPPISSKTARIINCEFNDATTVLFNHETNVHSKSQATTKWKKSNFEIMIKLDGLQTWTDSLRGPLDSKNLFHGDKPLKKNKMADDEPVALNVYKRLKSLKDHVAKPAKEDQHTEKVSNIKLHDRHDSDVTLYNIVGDSCPPDLINGISSVGQAKTKIRSVATDYSNGTFSKKVGKNLKNVI